ncbi:MAG: 16S rRNA (guanine(966)-N(2))-methyltransferase RsmD [Lachnospiraceae bacterium]|jgi:16S rRNA (guanine966-N2)-methyltransferase|nr:16S rRNA (guanine(966)-N(2))-methyltransferase RsmD [Lachnospiraceae bacterium]
MRIIAGKARSLPLKTPAGPQTRPTSDRIKETLFNMLMPYLPGCVFLDLFAGSGQIGIEALSRGAKKAYFAENGREAFACVSDNVKFAKMTEEAVLLKQDVYTALYGIHEKEAGVIFADPPYEGGHYEKLLSVLKDISYVTEDTLLVFEADLKRDFGFAKDYGFIVEKEKSYKTNKHVFLRKGVL